MATKKKSKHKPTLQVLEWDESLPIAPGTRSRARMLRGCEWAIPGILTQILNTGLQRIAVFGQSGKAERCAVEAEHLRHLPGLLADFDAEVLDRYWNVERPAYVQKSSRADLKAFESMWADLAEVFEARKSEIAAGIG
jgi:hypothetical protein